MLENFAKSIIKTVPQWVKSCEIVHNEIMITVHPEFIVPMCYFLRQNIKIFVILSYVNILLLQAI